MVDINYLGPVPSVTKFPKLKNGYVIQRVGNANCYVYERLNDPDGDWIPDLEEDKMGTS